VKNLRKLIFIKLVSILLIFHFSGYKLFSCTKINLVHQYSQLYSQGEKSTLAGEFNESIKFFEKSLIIARKMPNKKKECESLLKLGLLYWNIEKFKESSDHYEKALYLAQKLNQKNFQEKCRNVLEIQRLYKEGKKLRSLGENEKSTECFLQAIDLARKIESKEHKVKCLRQLSVRYWDLKNIQDFFLLNKEALAIAQSLNHKKEEGKCLNHIGIYYETLDNYSKALNFYEEALTIAKDIKDKVNESACLTNIGTIYGKIGDYDKALEFLIKALRKDQLLRNDEYVSIDLINVGEIWRRNGLVSGDKEHFDKALSYFHDCLELIRKTGDRQTEVYVLNNIGSVQSELRKYKDALKHFESSYEMAEKIKDIEMMGMILNNIGIVHYNQGNYEKSTEYNQKAIDLALGIEGEQILWEAYLEIARAYEKQNKFIEALENYEESIRIIENIRSKIELEELKARYLGTDKRIDAYHYLIHLLVAFPQSHQEEEYNLKAFNYLERAKARAFLDSLELSNVNISPKIGSKLQNKEKELMKDISKLYAKLLAAELSTEEKNVIEEKLKNKENELDSLKREMRTKSPAYTNLIYPENITLDETQRELLDSNTAFFAYCLGKEHSYAFVITKKDFRIFLLPSRVNIQKKVSDYLKIISDKATNNFKLGYKLFETLVLPGLDNNIKNIIFIPDGILHFLPYETLITHKEKRDWLIKDYKIAYAPSISSLREIIQRKKSNGPKPRMDILAFGDPFFGPWETGDNGSDIFQNYYSSNAFNFFRLKYSGFEIDKISSLFKKRKRKIFRRKQANKEQLINHNLDDYKIIHFATHSIIDENIPARSSIVLSQDEDLTQDGFLQMREIYNLKLNSDLVTLSSCQTGLGEFIKGEGIEGINRAFFYAGTSSVLMSLWAVNDQASYQLMERFYFHLRSSESIMSALRKAKLELINSNTLSHPYYWAGFIVSGKADEVIFTPSINKWLFSGISFLFVAGLVFVAVRSHKKKLKISF
jgi:CHAT domain-containing protein/tetratricopeptide (TPR) repeat protein